MSDKMPAKLPQKAVDAYDRIVHRVEEAVANIEDRTWEAVKEEIDRAVEFEQGVAELTREEMDLLGAYVKRDLEGMLKFVSETGHDLSEWFKVDVALVEKKIFNSLLSIADKTRVEQVELEHKTHRDFGVYVNGEVASPGMLQCSECSYMVCLTRTAMIEPCHECGNHYFRRITARWPRSKEGE
ncbi:MAG: metalloendopeptidase [Gammaproteobacteria bacterium]|nr:MAG: metalloendopeptidase [Pseudomonadota bacterium]PIE37891.1 MAG: metalloendopeptidase [Gammaproteobacteria bacterium]